MRPNSRRGRLLGLSGLLLLVSAAIVPASVDADRIAEPDYVGSGRPDREMKIEFRIYRRGQRELVDFQARDVKFYCDDETTQRLTSIIIRTALDEDGRGFDQVLYDNSSGETWLWFRGALLDNGRTARGSLFSTYNPEEPEDGEGQPECSTSGKHRWVARRLSQAEQP